MPVKRGDVVIYKQGDKTYNALVLALSPNNESHLGADDEPALHIAVLFDEPLVNGKPKEMPPGYLPEPKVIHDVVHESHEFDEDYKLRNGADFHKHRGAGEWSAAEVVPVVDVSAIAESPAEVAPVAKSKKPKPFGA